MSRTSIVARCLPPILLCELDTILTLVGQPAEYWSKSHQYVNEASPTLHHLLAIHPLVFVGGMLIWMGVFVSLVLLMRDRFALVVATTVTMGHLYGAEAWLRRLTHSYEMSGGLALVAGVLLALGISVGWQLTPQSERAIRLPTWPRRAAIAGLLGFAGYFFLVP